MSNRTSKKPSLRALSFILRHRALWPKGFKWDYSHCDTCAMGLAQQTWPDQVQNLSGDDISDALGINDDVADHIFADVGAIHGIPNAFVTPVMVADIIDELEDA